MTHKNGNGGFSPFGKMPPPGQSKLDKALRKMVGEPEPDFDQPSEVLDQQPPRNLDAEKAAIASALLLPSIMPEMMEAIRPIDFYGDDTKIIWRGLCHLKSQGCEPDILTLMNWLRSEPAPNGDTMYEFVGGRTGAGGNCAIRTHGRAWAALRQDHCSFVGRASIHPSQYDDSEGRLRPEC